MKNISVNILFILYKTQKYIKAISLFTIIDRTHTKTKARGLLKVIYVNLKLSWYK